jgi:hypothetical protein
MGIESCKIIRLLQPPPCPDRSFQGCVDEHFSFGNGSQAIDIATARFRLSFQTRFEIIEHKSARGDGPAHLHGSAGGGLALQFARDLHCGHAGMHHHQVHVDGGHVVRVLALLLNNGKGWRGIECADDVC